MVSLSVAVSQHTLSLSELDNIMTVVALFTFSHVLFSTHIYTRRPLMWVSRSPTCVTHGPNSQYLRHASIRGLVK